MCKEMVSTMPSVTEVECKLRTLVMAVVWSLICALTGQDSKGLHLCQRGINVKEASTVNSD